MDDPPDAAPPGSALPEAPSPPRSRTPGRVSFALAVLALVAYGAGAVLLLVPVRTPQVQDCGAPGAFLLEGRVDVVPDPEGRIRGPEGAVVQLPAPVAEAARDRPCRERVAARAVPGLALMAGATLVGVGAFALELFVVRPRLRRSRTETTPADGSPPPPNPGEPD